MDPDNYLRDNPNGKNRNYFCINLILLGFILEKYQEPEDLA